MVCTRFIGGLKSSHGKVDKRAQHALPFAWIEFGILTFLLLYFIGKVVAGDYTAVTGALKTV